MKTIAASDSTSWLHCHGRVWLDKNPPAGQQPVAPSEFDQLIIRMGLGHEWNIKRELERKFQFVEAVSEEHTRALMEAGCQVIYQGQLTEGDIIGKPDFLIRHESGQYQAADAKLARSEEKKEIQIQLGIYRQLLGNNLNALVFLGTGEVVEIGAQCASGILSASF